VAPTELRKVLLTQGTGRYRVSCVDRRGCFLLGGSFVVEVSAESLEPIRVEPRTPRDYPRRPPSDAHALKRGTQRIEQRVEALQADLREAYGARARTERATATQREKHLKELRHLHETVETLHEQVGRLVERVKELESREDARHRKGRASLIEVREELANERRQRQADVARLAANVAPVSGVPTSLNQGAQPDPRATEPGHAAVVDDTRPPIGETPAPPLSVPPLTGEVARAPGFAALAGVRAVPRRNPVTSATSAARATTRPSSLGDALDAFFRLRPPRPR